MIRTQLSEMPLRQAFGLLNSIVAPRPIAFVSTLSGEGKGNLAPFSYFNLGGGNPPSVVFSVLNDRHGTEKDTLINLRETREYTISVVRRSMAEKMNLTSIRYPRGISEFSEAGFTPMASELVQPPWVGESPVAMECRLHAIVPHGEGPLSANYVIGTVLLVHVLEAVADPEGRIDPRKVDFLARLGGDWYAHVSADSLFELPRPPEVGSG